MFSSNKQQNKGTHTHPYQKNGNYLLSQSLRSHRGVAYNCSLLIWVEEIILYTDLCLNWGFGYDTVSTVPVFNECGSYFSLYHYKVFALCVCVCVCVCVY